MTPALITWEQWWARNQYEYLQAAPLADRMDDYPVTPAASEGRSLLRAWEEKCIALLRPLLDHDSARLRRGALIGLARLNDKGSLAPMIACLKDRNQTVRDTALLALGIMESEQAKHSLLHIARGSERSCRATGQSSLPDYFRGFAEISLAMSRTRGADALIRTLALDRNCPEDVRAMALESLGILGSAEGMNLLARFTEDKKVPSKLLSAAVTALGKTRDPAMIPLLEKALSSRHLAVQQSAAISLGRMDTAGDKDRLVKRLYACYGRHHDQALRGFSLVSMGQIGGQEAIRYLKHVTKKGKKADLPWALLGLGFAWSGVKSPGSLEPLLGPLTSHGDRSVRSAAAIALGLAGDNRALPALTAMLERGDDPCLRGYCALAMGMLGEASAAADLRKALEKDNQPQVTVHAARALALLKDSDSARALLEILLSSGNDYTKSLTAQSLVFMGDRSVLEELCRRMEEGKLDDLTFLHCIHLTTRLLTGAMEPYLDRLAAGSNFASESPLVTHLLAADV